MLEIINPENEQVWLEARLKDVTSTEVSALFGISPYQTPFELWHRKHDGVVVRLDPNERMELGTDLQDAIAAHIAKKQGWTIRRKTEYIRDTDVRLGASFDFEAIATADIGKLGQVDKPYSFLLEIKNIDGLVFKNDWIADENGNLTGPNHIEAQVQVQLAVSGYDVCYIGACIGGNHIEIIKRTRDEAVISAIKQKVSEFWASIEANTPPAPDFQADAEFIGKLFGCAEPGKVLNVVEDAKILKMAQEYKALGDAIKTAEAGRDAIKAELLTIVGDAEKVIGDGFTISAGVQGPKMIEAYERAGFRSFRITWRKQK